MAEMIGLPLNRFITVHWQAAGIPLEAMAKATGQFLGLLKKWLARRQRHTAWIWVHENGDNIGGHCHMLAHVPPDCVTHLTAVQKRWLRTITNRAYRRKVIRSVPIGGRLGLEASNPDVHWTNLETLLDYVTKGATMTTMSRFQAPGGRIVGKRCGTSQNIGRKARSAPAEMNDFDRKSFRVAFRRTP